ncbi:MAG: hypothetical protein OEW21_00130 [Betaproteobacteria bacterium]|nr:hypothetical protein [Betaproteobacteria bacterium]
MRQISAAGLAIPLPAILAWPACADELAGALCGAVARRDLLGALVAHESAATVAVRR